VTVAQHEKIVCNLRRNQGSYQAVNAPAAFPLACDHAPAGVNRIATEQVLNFIEAKPDLSHGPLHSWFGSHNALCTLMASGAIGRFSYVVRKRSPPHGSRRYRDFARFCGLAKDAGHDPQPEAAIFVPSIVESLQARVWGTASPDRSRARVVARAPAARAQLRAHRRAFKIHRAGPPFSTSLPGRMALAPDRAAIFPLEVVLTGLRG
jgi:hypothetical protein